MDKKRTPFGIWLDIFCAKNRTNSAQVAEGLGLSRAALSLISSGKRSIPRFLRENIISKYNLHQEDIQELDASIYATELEALPVKKNEMDYVLIQTLNDRTWTQEIMKLMASAVNKMTKEESERIKEQLSKIDRRPFNINQSNNMYTTNIEEIKKDVHKRYGGTTDVAERIIQYIESKRQ